MQQFPSSYPDRAMSLGQNISKKAAEKLFKSNIKNIETVKNRLKVLSSQAQYNRLRQKYQAEMIERHHQIHQKRMNERVQINQKLKTLVDISQKQQQAVKIKSELKEKLSEVFKKVKQQKINQRNDIKMRSDKNRQFLAQRRIQEFQRCKSIKEQVAETEKGIKQALQRFKQEKRQDVRYKKQVQKKQLLNYSSEMSRQLQFLSKKEKELIDINSQSMRSSRIVSLQYNQLYRGKPKQQGHLLPEIRKKSPSHSTSTHFD